MQWNVLKVINTNIKMKATTIGVYDTDKQVLGAIKALKENHFSNKEISVIWQQKDLQDESSQEQESKITKTAAVEVGAGLTIGGALGALTGLGIIAIPGLGFLFGAGALVGLVAGVDFGAIVGTIIGALSIPGIKKQHEEKYDAELKAGKHLVLVQGSREKMEEAKRILEEHGQFSSIEIHE